MNFRQKRKTLRTRSVRNLGALVTALALLATATASAQTPAAKTAPPAPNPSSNTAKPGPTVKANPQATRVLDQAIAKLQKVTSAEAALSQQFTVGEFRLTLDGKLLSAPGYKLHAELESHRPGLAGKRTIISDGTTLWEIIQAGNKAPQVARINLKTVAKTLRQPDVPKGVEELFYVRHGFLGPLAILQKAHELMTPFHLDKGVDLDGRKVDRVAATWAKPVRNQLSRATEYFFRMGAIGQALLYIDPKTGWLYRVDWDAQVGPSQMMRTLRIEFRDPKFSPTLTAQQQAEFTYNPGSLDIHDRTEEAVSEIQSIARELKAKGSATGTAKP